jgi:outer membrane immunogenic protein
MFKRYLAGLAALSATPALAADLPSLKAPVAPALPVVEAADWTGFYIGADLGGAWGAAKFSNPGAAFTVNGSSVLGGGFVGYNRQYGGLVLGLEGDVQGLGLDRRDAVNALRVQQNLLASINGRLGFAFGNVLIYAIGGVAFTDTRLNLGALAFNGNGTGFDVGGGLEYAFSPNWTLRAEYRYYDFGTVNRAIPNPPVVGGVTPWKVAKTDNTFRVGLAYKFGVAEAVPVVAKY